MHLISQNKNSIPEFEDIFSFESILESFNEFKRNKKYKNDVVAFSMNLIGNLFSLHNDLMSGVYKHGGYRHFKISDPKPRDIHKASVRDRIVHHCIYRSLYPHFNRYFVHDSYSCRFEKGTHKAVRRFESFGRKESKNNTKTIWALKGDIKKCFASVDHDILKLVLRNYLRCDKILNITGSIIDSFNSGFSGSGIPLGNLTSQLFINIYLNEFDQFMKRELKTKFYIRYADDFIVLSRDKDYLWELVPKIADFLGEELKLSLHPNKLFVKTLASGVDFLGWIQFPNHRVLRTSTKNRVFKKLEKEFKKETVASYLGMLKYGNTFKLSEKIRGKNSDVVIHNHFVDTNEMVQIGSGAERSIKTHKNTSCCFCNSFSAI